MISNTHTHIVSYNRAYVNVLVSSSEHKFRINFLLKSFSYIIVSYVIKSHFPFSLRLIYDIHFPIYGCFQLIHSIWNECQGKRQQSKELTMKGEQRNKKCKSPIHKSITKELTFFSQQ